MEFKRIDNETVNCIITEDDMDEQGITIEDLFEKRKEAMDFLHDVMRKAQEEVDYKPTGSITPLQITVLPDHTISLTLSETTSSFSDLLKTVTQQNGVKLPKDILKDLGDCDNEEKMQRLNEYLQNLKHLTSAMKNMIVDKKDKKDNGKEKINLGAGADADTRREIYDNIANKVSDKRKDFGSNGNTKKEDLERLKFNEYIFSFADMTTVISFCAKTPKDLHVASSLYRDSGNGDYFLHLVRCDEEAKRFASLFTMAYEFGHFYASNSSHIAHITETSECIIKEDALKKLAVIA